MERKTIKRKRLKKRILISITLVLMGAMISSTVGSYLYFSKVVQNQVISDERSKLNQLSNQIKFMTEDIRNFTRSIIVDDDIQDVLHEISHDSTYSKVKYEDNIAKRLVFYNSLRTYIWSTYIRIEDGTFYGGVNPRALMDAEIIYQSEEMQEYQEHPEWIYSDPYPGQDQIKTGDIVCFRADMLNVKSFGRRQGTIFMEIYLKYFTDQIEEYATRQENICLVGNDNQVIYTTKAGENFNYFPDEQKKELITGTYKINQGYLLCDEITGTGWKICTIITNATLFERSSSVLAFCLLIYLISVTLTLLVTSRLLTNITRPITSLSKQMGRMDYQNLQVEEMVRTGDEIETLYECYSDMLDEIRASINRQMEYEKQKTSMEFDIMLSQINPHYLYNVLNTVMYLGAEKKDDRIVEIVQSLIYTLQETIKVGEKNIETTIEKELELTECYLTIQKYRYPDQFQVEITCEDDCRHCLVPKTIIQPLVENAIVHGIIPTEENGLVKVNISRSDNVLLIQVVDDGIGITEDGIKRFENGEEITQENGRSHIGIRNVKDRIRYLYGDPYGMWIERRTPAGTLVRLELPIKKNEQNYRM